jgi:hypothetical protein
MVWLKYLQKNNAYICKVVQNKYLQQTTNIFNKYSIFEMI